MDKVKRIMSATHKQEQQPQQQLQPRPQPRAVHFLLGASDSGTKAKWRQGGGSTRKDKRTEIDLRLSSPLSTLSKRAGSNLRRTRSRSVENMKNADLRRTIKRNVLWSHLDDNSGSETSSLGLPDPPAALRPTAPFKGGRSQSYYAFRPRALNTPPPPPAPPGSSSVNLSPALSAHRRSPSYYGSPSLVASRRQQHGRMARCGSVPPGVQDNSLLCARSLGNLTLSPSSRYQGLEAGDFLAPTRLQSEEDLLLDRQRIQEKSWMNSTRMKQETDILKNIKKREIVDMKRKEFLSPPPLPANQSLPASAVSASAAGTSAPSQASSSKSPALSSPPRTKRPPPPPPPPVSVRRAPLPLLPVSSATLQPRAPHEGRKSVAAGLFGSSAVFLAPTTAAALIIPSFAQPSHSLSEKEKMAKWVPPPQEKPRDRQLVRLMADVRLIKTPTPCSSPLAQSEFTLECLNRHNYYRNFHSAPPMQVDEQLCASAQYWANLLGHRDEYQHQSPEDPGHNPNLGENLFTWPVVWHAAVARPELGEGAFGFGGGGHRARSARSKVVDAQQPDIKGREVAAFWYKTMRKYYFLKDPAVLHVHACQFSQMVWRSTTRFGCGKARSRSGKIIVVAHYYPRGNIPGEFADNVLPPTDKFVGEDEDEEGEGVEDEENSVGGGSGSDGVGERREGRKRRRKKKWWKVPFQHIDTRE